MNIKTKFYWSLYIQWLAKEDILNEWLDAYLIMPVPSYVPYQWRNINLTQVYTDNQLSPDINWYNLDASDKQNVYLDATIRKASNSRDILLRITLLNYVNNLNKPDHPYHQKRWWDINELFNREVLTRKIKTINTNRLKKAFNASYTPTADYPPLI